jgi:hypothetical protein
MKKGTLIALLIAVTVFAKAQTANKITANQKSLLVNKWFESPRETSGDTVTFSTSKHIHQPGVDNPAVAFGELTFSEAPEFNVNYWRWCTKTQNAYVGKWSIAGSGTAVKLDFGKLKCKNELTILELTKDKLKVVIKETSN